MSKLFFTDFPNHLCSPLGSVGSAISVPIFMGRPGIVKHHILFAFLVCYNLHGCFWVFFLPLILRVLESGNGQTAPCQRNLHFDVCHCVLVASALLITVKLGLSFCSTGTEQPYSSVATVSQTRNDKTCPTLLKPVTWPSEIISQVPIKKTYRENQNILLGYFSKDVSNCLLTIGIKPREFTFGGSQKDCGNIWAKQEIANSKILKEQVSERKYSVLKLHRYFLWKNELNW